MIKKTGSSKHNHSNLPYIIQLKVKQTNEYFSMTSVHGFRNKQIKQFGIISSIAASQNHKQTTKERRKPRSKANNLTVTTDFSSYVKAIQFQLYLKLFEPVETNRH